VWFCLYFASLSFGDERQRGIGASPDEAGLMYEIMGPNRAAEISATTGDDGSNEIFKLLANVVPANSSANFNDSNANITFLTELSTNDDFIRANNTSLILLHTSTVTNIQSVVENHSSDQPPTSKTLENLPPTKEYNGASTSETLENLPPTKEYNDASALISERPCRWALIKKQPPPAGSVCNELTNDDIVR
uniref:Uncharacterized protein n=1 Tax=Parascaris univalens TaxID=6257 RepID=A0A914ZSU6_PARUN